MGGDGRTLVDGEEEETVEREERFAPELFRVKGEKERDKKERESEREVRD